MSGSADSLETTRSRYALHTLLGPLVESYIKGLPAALGALDQAVRAGEESDILRLSHRLCGDAATYGFAPLADLAREVELAKPQDRGEAMRQLNELSRRICRAL